MKVLVIAPHPDDEVLGCGGVMARHVAKGDDVFVLLATRGAPEFYSDEQVESTRREMLDAHRTLGVTETRFLEFPAPKLDTVAGCTIADAVGKVIADIRPQTVYLPFPGDIHKDHQVVHEAAMVACRPVYDHRPETILCYETLSETEWASPIGNMGFMPTYFVDIDRFLAKKLEAMQCFASQLRDFPNPRSLGAIEHLARFRGASVNLAAAEAFVPVRQIVP